jgi:aryl-alcohol dehydrogenase
MSTITAAVVRDAGGPFLLDEITLAEPRPDEMRVRIVASGICHADLIARDQFYPVPLPVVLGHEGAGVIEAVGNAVTQFAPGDHVILGYAACHHCRMCATGRPAYCVDGFALKFGGQRPDGTTAYSHQGERVNGHFFGQSSFATHSIVHETCAVRVPADAPLEVLAPFACGVLTGVGAVLNSLQVPTGAHVVVFGAGSVGLSAVMGARLIGARRIVAIDVNPARLALARELGATEVIDVTSEPDIPGAVREACDGLVEFALETSGNVGAARQAVDSLTIGGTVGMIGVTSDRAEVTFNQASIVHGLNVRGIILGDAVPDEFLPRLVDFHARGQLPVEKIVSTLPFADIDAAARAAEHGEIVKAVVTMGEL